MKKYIVEHYSLNKRDFCSRDTTVEKTLEIPCRMGIHHSHPLIQGDISSESIQ